VNSNDENGVLFGRWGSNFSDGTKPWAWTGSPEILEKYMVARQPVKYGQCWNYCGLTTTCKLYFYENNFIRIRG